MSYTSHITLDRLGGRLLNVSDGLWRPRSRGQVVIGETPSPTPSPSAHSCRCVPRGVNLGITRLAGFGVLTLGSWWGREMVLTRAN